MKASRRRTLVFAVLGVVLSLTLATLAVEGILRLLPKRALHTRRLAVEREIGTASPLCRSSASTRWTALLPTGRSSICGTVIRILTRAPAGGVVELLRDRLVTGNR